MATLSSGKGAFTCPSASTLKKFPPPSFGPRWKRRLTGGWSRTARQTCPKFPCWSSKITSNAGGSSQLSKPLHGGQSPRLHRDSDAGDCRVLETHAAPFKPSLRFRHLGARDLA